MKLSLVTPFNDTLIECKTFIKEIISPVGDQVPRPQGWLHNDSRECSAHQPRWGHAPGLRGLMPEMMSETVTYVVCLVKPESVRGQRWESYIWGQCFPAISTCLSPGEVESALKTWQIFSPRAQQWQRRLHPGQVLPGQGLPGILLCHRTPPVPRSWEFQAPIGIFHSSPGQGALHNPRDPSTLLRPIWDQPWYTGAK